MSEKSKDLWKNLPALHNPSLFYILTKFYLFLYLDSNAENVFCSLINCLVVFHVWSGRHNSDSVSNRLGSNPSDNLCVLFLSSRLNCQVFLFTQVYKWVQVNLMLGVGKRRIKGELEIFDLVASCYRNWDKL